MALDPSEPVYSFRAALAAASRLPPDLRRAALSAARRRRDDLVASAALRWIVQRLQPDASDRAARLWFWFNHFNVYPPKSLVGAALPSYLDQALEPHLDGHFWKLLKAVITHPAMLVYLDNVSNRAERLNENLGRELLELHTLGVDGGYGQDDVREVSRLLTGLGLRPLHRQPSDSSAFLHAQTWFEPRLHDHGKKRILGREYDEGALDDFDALFVNLARHPSTARNISRKLATFYGGDSVPDAEVSKLCATFLDCDGRLDIVNGEALALSRYRLSRGKARTFKDPMRWLFDAMDLYIQGSATVDDASPVLRWLRALGQPLFGCSTPDGFSLRGADWVGSGQISTRFEIAGEFVESMQRIASRGHASEAAWSSLRVQRMLSAMPGRERAAVEDAAQDTRLSWALLLSSPTAMHG